MPPARSFAAQGAGGSLWCRKCPIETRPQTGRAGSLNSESQCKPGKGSLGRRAAKPQSKGMRRGLRPARHHAKVATDAKGSVPADRRELGTRHFVPPRGGFWFGHARPPAVVTQTSGLPCRRLPVCQSSGKARGRGSKKARVGRAGHAGRRPAIQQTRDLRYGGGDAET